jgi:hypothetical protein
MILKDTLMLQYGTFNVCGSVALRSIFFWKRRPDGSEYGQPHEVRRRSWFPVSSTGFVSANSSKF